MTMKALATPYLGLSQLPNKPCFPVGHPVPSADHVTAGSTCPSPQQTGLPAYLSRVPSLPETIYGHGSSPMAMHHRHARPDERYNSPMTAAPPSAHMPYHYEHLMASHPYATMYPGFDMNSIKRKNATRESTSALKAWLYQHRKNPYPTKAEKVMLAIVSHMTLTQVSTWFANARRRLKKENKLEDGDIDLDDLDDQASTSQHSDYDSDVTSGAANTSIALTDISDNSDLDEQTTNPPPAKRQCTRGLISPDNRNEVFLDRLSAPVDKQAAPISGHHNHFNIIRNNNCAENMVTMRQSETSVSDEPTNLKVIADASSVKTKRETESDPETAKRQSNEKVQLNTKGQANANHNTPKHKIWSIANIIA